VKELGDKAAQGRACGNLGNTHYLLGNFKLAIRYHEEVCAFRNVIYIAESEKYHPVHPIFADCSEIVISVSIAYYLQFIKKLMGWVRVMEFNATFNNISVIWWRLNINGMKHYKINT
jgi:hypothetical protein